MVPRQGPAGRRWRPVLVLAVLAAIDQNVDLQSFRPDINGLGPALRHSLAGAGQGPGPSVSTGSAYVAAEWPRRLSGSGSEPTLGATRYRNLSWCSDLVGERLNRVANALTMKTQRSRSLDKAIDRA